MVKRRGPRFAVEDAEFVIVPENALFVRYDVNQLTAKSVTPTKF